MGNQGIPSIMKYFYKLVILSFLAISLNSQSNPLSTLKRGNDVLDFHQAVIQNPQALIMMHFDIVSIFQYSGNKYKDLNNELAVKLGIIKNLTFSGLEQVTFFHSPLNGYPYRAYSVEFSGVSYQDCIVLANYKPLQGIFENIKINGNPTNKGLSCKEEWFFQSGKNILKYVGR